jgi:hypothetical protein
MGLQWPGRQADYSPTFNAEIRLPGAIPPLRMHVNGVVFSHGAELHLKFHIHKVTTNVALSMHGVSKRALQL